MNFILCGLPACGKTTVGQLLAHQLGYSFIDGDRQLEHDYEKIAGKFLICRQIFSCVGEQRFRQLEKQMIASLITCEKSVIAAGGGALNDPANIHVFKSIGRIIYLKNDSQLLFERLTKNQIPAYLDPHHPYESFKNMIHQRLSIYEAVADIHVNTCSMTPTEIVSLISEMLAGKF